MNIRSDAWLFSESTGRIVISCARHHLEPLEALAQRHRVTLALIGKAGGTHLSIGPWIDAPVEGLHEAWSTGLQTLLPPTPNSQPPTQHG